MTDERTAREEARLAALGRYAVLDTPDAAILDDIARIAAQICRTPVGLVTLVDRERQWFKAAHGTTLRETPRDISFCTHTIEGSYPMVVADTHADPRFATSPLVIDGPRVRFYAGAPLQTADGHALGTLCVIDMEPRELDRSQIEALEALARQVMANLELRRTLAEHRDSEAHRELLLHELNHRVKNTLSVVQAIVTQSLRNAPDVASGRRLIEDRLRTLGRAHDLLVRSSWTGAPMAAVVDGALAPFAAWSDRIEVRGEPLDLAPRAALALSMALNELCANAVKYGALANTGGTVSLHWDVHDATLVLIWQEQGGPAVTPPSRAGFGTRLMRGLAPDLGGTPVADYAGAGLCWRLEAAMAAIIPGAEELLPAG